MTTFKHYGWIAVDFDGTLATYDGWKGLTILGDPVPPMIDRVKAWLANGYEVRIFTARISNIERQSRRAAIAAIDAWCLQHIGMILPVTNVKDMAMLALYDDRAVQIELNTGRVIGHDSHGLDFTRTRPQ